MIITSLESLRTFVPSGLIIEQMSADQIVQEFCWLLSGYADEKDSHGVSIGLNKERQHRLLALQLFILRSLSGEVLQIRALESLRSLNLSPSLSRLLSN